MFAPPRKSTIKFFAIFFMMVVFLFSQNGALAATETIWASSHITGTFTNPNNALNATDAVWAGQLNTNVSQTSRWAMGNPSSTITSTQTINIIARKGSNSGTPTIALNLYENGTLVQSIAGATSITSTTGQTVTGTFNASAITNPANVEIEVVMTAAGGNASTRNSAQIDSIEWIATLLDAATTIADGTNPENATLAPGAAITDLDAFTLQTNVGSDTVTAVVVGLSPAGAYNNIAQVDLTDNSNVVRCTAVTNPGSNTITFSTCTSNGGIPVSTSATTYKVRVTPKTHALMPAVPGASYATTGTVTSFTSTNAQAGTDSGSAAVIVDNLSPNGATSVSGSAGNAQVTLNWTTSASGDFSRSVILRWTGSSAGSEVPVEGTDYSNGNTISTATVVCVRTADAASSAVSGVDGAGTGGCNGTALTNSQAYTYKIFQKDSNGNYDAGTTMGTFTPTLTTTTLGNGTDPSNTSLAPGGSATMADAFTLVTSTGTDSITAAVVGLASGTSGGLSLVEITNDAGTVVYGSTSNPASDTPSISLSSLTATTVSTQYKIRVTPKSHTNMPVPPGSTYLVTAKINSWTGTNAQAGSDTAGTTVTIDNTSPAGTTGASATGSDTQIQVSWTNPADSDFQKVIIYCKTASITEVPTEGTDPSTDGSTCDGTARVKYSGSTSPQSFTGLTNGTTYYFRIYARDTNGNFTAIASTQQVSAAPSPTPTTTLATGSDPTAATIAPGTSATDVNQFTLQTNTSTETVTSVTVNLSTNSGVGLLAITNSSNTVLGSTASPVTGSNTVSVSSMSAGTSVATFKVRVTPLAHDSMPAVPGGAYTITAPVTAWAGSYAHTGSDTNTNALTIDNLSPANITGATGSAGNAQVALNWTNPTDSDFHSAVVLRRASSAVANVPAEGTTYTAGNTIGTATVACVIATPTETCTDTGLTNGTAYHYKIFAKDTNGNYSETGVTPSASPFTPSVTTFTITATAGTGGTVIPAGATVAAQGSSVEYTITPDTGYNIATLTIDGSSTATSTTYTFGNIQQNHTIAATFVAIPPPPGTFAITATAGANGTVTPAGITNVTQGGSQMYTITPNSGYNIATLTIDSVSIATSTTYTFTDVQTTHTINATFVAISAPPGSFTITATTGTHGTISPLGSTIVAQGNSQAYTITPDTGYNIATLTVDSVSVATSTTYTFTNVQASHTIAATFVAISGAAAGAIPDTGTSRPTTVIFSGKAFPGGKISVINKTLSTEKLTGQENIASADGSFSVSFIGILQGLQSFGLIAKDKDQRTAQTKFFFVDTTSESFTDKDIIIPPTIDIANGQVSRGGNATIFGYATPDYTINLYLDDILMREISVEQSGLYKFEIPTGALEFGQHKVKVKQTNPLEKKGSDFSTTRTFIVSRLSVIRADLSGDGKVDIRDWSIFLSRWGAKGSLGRESIDFNGDEKVDIADFSIFIKTIRKK